MQKSFIFIIVSILFLTLVSASHPSEEIINNPKTIAVNFTNPLVIVGNNCYSRGDVPTEIEQQLLISKGGKYEIYSKVLRGSANQQQTNESFFIEINNIQGPISTDDSQPDLISERIDFSGSFDLSAETHTIKIKTAANCPPDKTANSVEIKTLYIFPIENNEECTDNCDNEEEPECTSDCDNEEEPCTENCDNEENEDKKMDNKAKVLDCPVEYYDPFPKYYNCPIDEYLNKEIEKQKLYNFSPKELNKILLESNSLIYLNNSKNPEVNNGVYAAYISLSIILTGLSTFLLVLLLLTASMQKY
ncbi:MAG: hypothetical protein Q7S27_01070 [Nanoarchaeota archaeon]|nr:hypothetical protein [Nanoarchaeota archaeon]